MFKIQQVRDLLKDEQKLKDEIKLQEQALANKKLELKSLTTRINRERYLVDDPLWQLLTCHVGEQATLVFEYYYKLTWCEKHEKWFYWDKCLDCVTQPKGLYWDYYPGWQISYKFNKTVYNNDLYHLGDCEHPSVLEYVDMKHMLELRRLYNRQRSDDKPCSHYHFMTYEPINYIVYGHQHAFAATYASRENCPF